MLDQNIIRSIRFPPLFRDEGPAGGDEYNTATGKREKRWERGEEKRKKFRVAVWR